MKWQVKVIIYGWMSMAFGNAWALLLPERALRLEQHPVKGWEVSYEAWIEKQLESVPALLRLKPESVKSLCSNWKQLNPEERKRFWVNFIRSMAFAESTYQRGNFYIERGFSAPDHVTGRVVISEGLLQLSYGSAAAYESKRSTGACDFVQDRKELLYAQADYQHYLRTRSQFSLYPNQKRILNPYQNLACGIEILYQLYLQNPNGENALMKSGARYWSTLRPEREGFIRFKNEYIKNNEVCVIPGKRGGVRVEILPTLPFLPPVPVTVVTEPEPTVLPPVVVTAKVKEPQVNWSELDAVLNEEVIRSLELP